MEWDTVALLLLLGMGQMHGFNQAEGAFETVGNFSVAYNDK